MDYSNLPTFFKRRFNQELFEKELHRSMKVWIKEKKSMFRDFEVNVINETMSNYFWDLYGLEIYDELNLDEVYKFESFITLNYLNDMREFWDRHH